MSIILNVDDNDGARDAKTRTLQRAGFTVLESANGSDALKLVQERLPDLVLLDTKLPDISGLEVCRRIKGNTATAAVLVLQTSASLIDSGDKVGGIEHRADNYLVGPVEPLELIANVNALLRLREMQRALLESEERIDELLATLAHELRNPLAAMRTAIDLMRFAEDGNPTPLNTAIDAREIISRQIDYLTRLVDDLLDVSRITQGKLLLKKSIVELQPIINSAIEANETYIRDRKHRLTVTTPSDTVLLYADSVRLAQVVGNLLHNAAEYTPAGGEISLSVSTIDDRLRIVIADNGIGIAQDTIGHIFELFTQAQRLDSKAPEGLGVGLSLVKRLIELHQGHIVAESPGPGCGSAFTIELPIDPKLSDDKPKNASRKKTASANGLRILLVDDSLDAVGVMRLLLKGIGHDVSVANDGATALELAPNLIPHVILLDIGLPGMNGYEVAKELVKVPELKQTTLVALTGYGQKKDREKAFASGFHHHFIKPVEIDDLTNFLGSIKAF